MRPRRLPEESRDLTGLGYADLSEWLSRRGYERFRAVQVLNWVHHGGVTDFNAMHNLPSVLREELASSFRLDWPPIKELRESVDGCRKLLFEMADGSRVESVVIPDGARLTLCLSTQVGCAMGCAFCATARIGLQRNLQAGEIVGQLRAAAAGSPRPFTSVVFMGMGEPLHNYEALVAAIDIMSAPWGLNLSQRRITVSTVGLIEPMMRLLSRTRVNLAVSLNATDDALRRRLMPAARRSALGELIEACRTLPLPRRKRVTFEYVLLRDVNDSLGQARALVKLISGVRCKINLIPFNRFPGAPFEMSEEGRAEAFRDLVLASGIQCSIRESRGGDIAAACGQLAAGGSAGSPAGGGNAGAGS